jgi:hypothetical protein
MHFYIASDATSTSIVVVAREREKKRRESFEKKYLSREKKEKRDRI